MSATGRASATPADERSWLQRRVTHPLQAAGAAALAGLLRPLPLPAASALGGWFVRTFGPLTGANKRAIRNLGLVMPELGKAERDRIIRAMWDNMGRTLVELTQMDRYGLPGETPYLEFEGAEHVRAAMEAGRPIACVSGHYSNWELSVLAGLSLGMQVVRVYRPANNPIIDRMITRWRKPGGGRLLAKGKDSRPLLAASRKGEPMGILFDQRLNEGETLPFFGKPANTTTLPAFLAIRRNYVILPTRCVRIDGCRIRILVEPALEPLADGTVEEKITAMTLELNQVLERWVRERPGEWFWLHNRWGKWRGDTLVPADFNAAGGNSLG